MIKSVQTLINLDIQQILPSAEYTILLLRTYSDLYLGGAVCSGCERSLRKYHEILKRTGMKKAEDKKESICKCNKKGIVYVSKLAKHIKLETISDKDAIFMLKNKFMQESDFEVLPYKKKEKKSKK